MRQTLIVRLPNWLGDTVMAVPTIRALRAAVPEAHLALAGPWAALLKGQELADVLVSYPRAWSGRLRAADAVRALAPDVAILLPNSFEAAAAAWYWQARRRIGFLDGGRGWLLTDRVPLPEPRRHQIDEYGLLIEALGARCDDGVPVLTPPAADADERVRVRALLDEVGVRGSGPLMAVHLGAVFGPSKMWPADRVVEFCRLARNEGVQPVLLGARVDLDFAEEILASVRVSSLVGRDSPDLLPAVLSEVDAIIAGDTGIGHLAAALGTPTVVLFGPTDWRLTAPRGPVDVVRHPTPCSPCFYRRCPIEHPCLRGVSARQVLDRARHLLAAAGAR